MPEEKSDKQKTSLIDKVALTIFWVICGGVGAIVLVMLFVQAVTGVFTPL